jgi:hypothetical protein
MQKGWLSEHGTVRVMVSPKNATQEAAKTWHQGADLGAVMSAFRQITYIHY